MITIALAGVVAIAATAGPARQSLDVKRSGGSTVISTQQGNFIRETTGRVTDAAVLSIPNSNTRVALWKETSRRGTSQFYGIAKYGTEFQRVAQADYTLKLKFAEFDPLVRVPRVPDELAGRHGNQLQLVQFVTQPVEAYRQEIRRIGGEIYNYVGNHAYICRLTTNEIEEVRSLPFVRWVGAYEPAYRLEPEIRAGLARGTLAPGKFYIQMCGDDLMMKQIAGANIFAIGGSVEGHDTEGTIMLATLTPQQVVEVANMDGVLWIDRWTQPSEDMNNIRANAGADTLETVHGFSGQGVRGHDVDGGVRATHTGFAGRLTVRTNSGSTSHGTNTFGILIGNGTGFPTGRGMLPNGHGVFSVYSTGGWPGRLSWTMDTVNVHNCVVETNSWGDSLTTQYTSISASMDEIVFKTDLVICNSMSNAGTTSVRPQAWGKNMLSVGGIYHFNTATTADDMWNSGASIGYAADGRIKPDLAFFYDQTDCASSSSDTSYTTSFSGTSSATPQTAGNVGLYFQLWSNGVFNNTNNNPPLSVFANRSHASLAKAVMIANAKQYTFAGTGVDKERNKQGFGLPSILNVYNNAMRTYIVNETDVIEELETTVHRIYIPAGTPELKATMIYQDYWGTTSSTLHRINKLNLRVTSPGGTVYHGNNGLKTGNYSTSGGSPNTVDNVECVFVNAPQAGIWLVEVTATDLVQDGHVETAGTVDADYSLAVVGADPYADLFDATVTHGFDVGGDLNSLRTSNDNRRILRAVPPISPLSPDAGVTVKATSPVTAPTSFTVGIESRATVGGVEMRVALWNYQSSQWDNFFAGQVFVGPTESSVFGVVSSNPARYINPANGEMQVRVWYHGDAAVGPAWDAQVDHVRVQVTP